MLAGAPVAVCKKGEGRGGRGGEGGRKEEGREGDVR